MNRRDALKSLTALPAATMISVAQLKPDDVIVVETDFTLSEETCQRITKQIEAVFKGHRCIVMGDGLKMKVYRHD